MKNIGITVLVVALILGGLGAYWLWYGPKTQNIIVNIPNTTSTVSTSTATSTPELLNYHNSDYGFNFALPPSWTGFKVITQTWTGTRVDDEGAKVTGPELIIRHPLWTAKQIRQDIPIMIFTLAQWELGKQGKLSLGAAPIGPTELGRNANYVFALPARYNFAFPEGYEEVQQIIDSKPLTTY